MVTVSALLTSVITSLVIALIVLALFVILQKRKGNYVVYYSARLAGDSGPPPDDRSPFQWLRDVFTVTEDSLVKYAGLDSAVYLIFLRTCLSIMLWSALYCLLVLVPICATDHYYRDHNKGITDSKKLLKYDSFDKLAMGNIKPKSDRIWAFAIGSYWVGLGSIYFLLRTYVAITKLRENYRNTEVVTPEKIAILVRDVPVGKGKGSPKELIDNYMSICHGSSYQQSVLVPKLGKVTKAWKKLDKMKRKLAHAKAVFEQSQVLGKSKRPQNKTGFLGLCGAKVDSIEYYTEEVSKKLVDLREQQKVALDTAGGAAAVSFFKTPIAASGASQSVHSAYTDRWVVSPAPEARDVVWENLGVPIYERTVRELAVYAITFLAVVFYMIPISLVSAVTTLNNLRKTLPFLKFIVNKPALATFLEAFLPQLALIIFLAILPMLCRVLSKLEGLPSRSHIERAACGKYFYFQVFNVFLGVTLTGSLFNALEQIKKNPSSIVNLLASSLPQNSTFFITFIGVKFLISKSVELSCLSTLVVYHLKKKFLCKTEQELADAWQPKALEYVKLVPSDMLVITLCLCYSVISPIILIFGAAYFAYTWIVYKNQVLNVYVPEYESEGRMWPHMHARMVAALVISQLTMLGYFGIKKFVGTIFIIPLPVITIVYYLYAYRRFYQSFRVTPLDVAALDQAEVPPMDALVGAYLPECLHEETEALPENSKALPVEPKESRGEKKGWLIQKAAVGAESDSQADNEQSHEV